MKTEGPLSLCALCICVNFCFGTGMACTVVCSCLVTFPCAHCWQSLFHASRFLPGAACSAVKLWLRAREILEGSKVAPVAVYDMASIGLAGYVIGCSDFFLLSK